ncbi:MAG: hypothetical protein ACI3WS_05415 [Phascolarctobacterium sp.]
MEIKTRNCLYCGASFTPKRDNHRFCSRHCSHYYHNRIGNQHKPADSQHVIREFMCKECGKHVMISDTKDKRTEFCNAKCCRDYYRHGRERKCTTNQGMSGGMSLGSLKRREARALM